MTKIDQETIRKVVEAASDPDVAMKILEEASLVAARRPDFPQNGGPPENAPTIPDDPDLSNIRYLTLLRRSIKGRRPDPLVMVALKAVMTKWGYPVLAKVIVKVARKMRFSLDSEDVEAILHKYGTVIVPFMAILLMDIVRRYEQVSHEQGTIELDVKS